MAMGILNIPLDEDDDDEARWGLTQEICAYCGDRLRFTDEVFLLQIVRVHEVQGKLEAYPVQDDDGDYLYTPHFIHLECWESVDEATRERIEDKPPVLCEKPLLDCSICSSSILDWEITVFITLGEIRLSERRPSGESSTQFFPNGHPETICIACIADILMEEITLWDGVSQNGECDDCSVERCWRTRLCECGCHAESSG